MAPRQSKPSLDAKYIFGWLFKLWKVNPIASFFFMISPVISASLSYVVAPIFIAQILDKITNSTATLANSYSLLLLYTGVIFLGSVIFPRISLTLAYWLEPKMQVKVQSMIITHLTQKSLNYHANKMGGGLVSDANKLVKAVEDFWDTITFSLIPTATTLILACFTLGIVFWQYAVVLSVLIIIFTITAIKFQLVILPKKKATTKKYSEMTAYFADVIGNISAVKSFAMEKEEQTAYLKKNLSWYKTLLSEMRSVVTIASVFQSISTLISFSALVAAILAVQLDLATASAIYLTVIYTNRVVSSLYEVNQTVRSAIKVIGEASPMLDILNSEIEIKDPKNPQPLTVTKGQVSFKKITFQYEDATEPLFDNFSLTITPGERIGLVGRSGSGKTSLTKLLLRFNDLQGGKILIDNQDITKTTQVDLHKAIAYVPQEPILFHRSLRENIAYGTPDASTEQIIEAAKKANAMEFIEKLPNSLDTIVGERGIKLSGGQRQRIAIARALIKDSPILVLDEATSALDSDTEKLIQKALFNLMEDKTCIIVAHRLSTISRLDRIIVLDNGKIIEQGSHQELLTKDGTYAQLWKHQSGDFLQEGTN